jgi:ABC-type antimicrobial peptide transport system permease subunit
MFPAFVEAVKGLDTSLPVDNMRTMAEQIENNSTGYRLVTTLSSGFAGLATLLAGIGLYAVIAYGVAQRLREFGIRMALGARAVDVGLLVLSQVAWLLLVGGGIGVALAFGLGRLSRAMLFGVEGLNPAAAGGALAVLATVALAAALVPARRAARVDPARALRAE